MLVAVNCFVVLCLYSIDSAKTTGIGYGYAMRGCVFVGKLMWLAIILRSYVFPVIRGFFVVPRMSQKMKLFLAGSGGAEETRSRVLSACSHFIHSPLDAALSPPRQDSNEQDEGNNRTVCAYFDLRLVKNQYEQPFASPHPQVPESHRQLNKNHGTILCRLRRLDFLQHVQSQPVAQGRRLLSLQGLCERNKVPMQ